MATLGLAGVRRGLAPLERAVVDRSDCSTRLDDRPRRWIAHGVVAVGLWVVVLVGTRGPAPLGLPLTILSLPFFLVLLDVLLPRYVLAERLRDPTDAERDRIASGMEQLPFRARNVVVYERPLETTPALLVTGRPAGSIFLDESLLEDVDDCELGVALSQASSASAGHYDATLATGSAFAIDALVLGGATFVGATVLDPAGSLRAAVLDPVTLGLATIAATATAFELFRSTRRIVYRADRTASDRFGSDAVEAVLDRHGASLPAVEPGTAGGRRYVYHHPTIEQRRTLLSRTDPEHRSLPDGLSIARRASAMGLGWALFGIAAFARQVGLPEAGAIPAASPWGAIATGLVVGTFAIGGYALVSGGTPVLWLPLTSREQPLDRSAVRRRWLSIALSGTVVAIAVELVANGFVHWGWLFLAVPLVWSLGQFVAHIPVFVPRAWVRRPTPAERETLETAYREFDRELGTVVVYSGASDWGTLAVTATGAGSTLWIDRSVLAAAAEPDLGVLLAQADERGRQSWYRRGHLLPITIVIVGLAGVAVAASAPSSAVAWVSTLVAVLAVLLLPVTARRGRGVVYRADSFTASIFDVETVDRVYGTNGSETRQTWFSLDESGTARSRLLALLASEPSLEQRLDRLGSAPDGSAQ